jgi:chromosome segregation ATPase
MQNSQLRRQLASVPRQPQPTQAPATPSGDIAELKQKLDRSEQDRIKASREVASLRNQLAGIQGAAQERDQLKQQVQSLSTENQQLHNEINNLQTMNTINGQVVQSRNLRPLRNVERAFMNHDQLRAYFTESLEKQYPPEAEQRQRAVLQALEMPAAGADRTAQVDDAVRSILGFYDHTTKQLVVVTDRPTMGVLDRVTYAHEFTHNLQDQHYDLNLLFARAAGNAD